MTRPDTTPPVRENPTTTVCGSLDRRGPHRPDTWQPLFPSGDRDRR